MTPADREKAALGTCYWIDKDELYFTVNIQDGRERTFGFVLTTG